MLDRLGLQVIRPERPVELTLVLDADNVDEVSFDKNLERLQVAIQASGLMTWNFDSPLQMKSIIWKFTEQGACVKALSRHCPKARAILSTEQVGCTVL